MASKIVAADDLGTQGIELTVHIDTSKVIDGAPDPAFVRTYRYGSFESSGNQGETKAQCRQRMKTEAKLLATVDADRVAPSRSSIASLIDS